MKIRILILILVSLGISGCDRLQEIINNTENEIYLVCEGKKDTITSNLGTIIKDKKVSVTYRFQYKKEKKFWVLNVDGHNLTFEPKIDTSPGSDYTMINFNSETIEVEIFNRDKKYNSRETININRISGKWKVVDERKENISRDPFIKWITEGSCEKVKKKI